MGRASSDAVARILEAAVRVITQKGAASLTIDAVAREASISKGGVLYHFGTKEALIMAIVEDAAQVYEEKVAALVAEDPEPHGRYTRALVRATLSDNLDARHAALLGAVAADLSLLEPMRALSLRLFPALVEDGLEPVSQILILSAADGLWAHRLFGLNAVPIALAPLRDRLVAMTRPTNPDPQNK